MVTNASLAWADDALRQYVNSPDSDGSLAPALEGLLRVFPERVGALGAVLWRSERTEADQPRSFYVVAHAFAGGKAFSHFGLPCDGSLVGRAFQQRKAVEDLDIQRNGFLKAGDPLYRQVDIKTLYAVPFEFTDGAGGVLAIYGDEVGKAFSPLAKQGANHVARSFPYAYAFVRRNIWLRVSLLLKDEFINEEPFDPASVFADPVDKWERICKRLAALYGCFEVSMFLLPDRKARRAELAATSWGDSMVERSYPTQDGLGATNYAYTRQQPIVVHDLRSVGDDSISGESGIYPGLTWTDSLGLKSIPLADGQPLSFMAAPVKAGDLSGVQAVPAERVVGVIRASVPRQSPFVFSWDDLNMLDSLARDIGRFWYSYQSRRARALQSHMDLAHQLKTPIEQAASRAARVVGYVNHLAPLGAVGVRDLRVIRGQLRRAQRVAASIRLLSALEGSQRLRLHAKELRYEEVEKIVREAAEDAEDLGRDNDLSFSVERRGVAALRQVSILGDRSLVEQAVTNICDNASKYSFEGAQVDVELRLARSGRLAISVASTSLSPRDGEIGLFFRRGYRSEEARQTAEGSGLGLYLVYNVMSAHGGEVVANRLKDGRIEFVLLFPVTRGDSVA